MDINGFVLTNKSILLVAGVMVDRYFSANYSLLLANLSVFVQSYFYFSWFKKTEHIYKGINLD